jgi:hypothetical protein
LVFEFLAFRYGTSSHPSKNSEKRKDEDMEKWLWWGVQPGLNKKPHHPSCRCAQGRE